jgi:hypothetical protein
MAAHLFQQGRLDQQEISRHLAGVQKDPNLASRLFASFQEPWIEDETERVFRMFIGV